MSVHYKFKAAKDYSTVTFDGIHISVADLKKEIIEQKRLAKNADFDLQIQSAQTKEVYEDENTLIPKNTSVIVARIPIAEKKRSQGPPGHGGPMGREGRFASQQRNHLANLPPSAVAKGVDLASMDASEEEKIKAMMSQSTADYDPSRYMKIRGQNQHGKLPDNYRCYKCQQSGHWINNCPMKHHESVDIKKSTGIPRSFMVVVDGPEVPGALITPEGQYAVPAIDHEAYLGKNKPQAEPIQKPKIPEELICPLCQDLLTDALLVPCCANSYCDECIRGALLESESEECPGCHEKDTSPNELIPNRFLRTAVNAFKNDTGYSKPVKLPDKRAEKESPHKEAQAAAAESRKLSVSLEELPDDLFPHSPRRIDSEEPADSTKDLYDFNDGSIPSPFARQEGNITPSEREHFGGGEHEKFPSNVAAVVPPPFHAPPPESQHNRDYGRPPPHGPPPHYRGGPPQYNQSEMRGPPPSHSNSSEPPPPGFGDVLPPGEDRPPPPQRHQHSGPPPHMMGHHDERQNHPSGPGPGQHMPPGHRSQGHPPPSQGQGHGQQGQGPQGHGPSHGHGQNLLPIPGHGQFNPMQPPPGYPSGPGNNMHPRPHMGGPPPPGSFPPHQYPPPNFNRMPPPGMNDMYHHQGPYGMDNRHHRDDFGRGRPPPRRPFMRDRMGRMPINDENRPGSIEDPLKEFERIMREKDRRKQMQSGALKKRSKSRTPSPVRRSPSPFRKRSLSPSYPRSPSPKRKRIIPMKRRNSFSRSRSRTPPHPPPIRRPPKSRSRSRERIRSISPHFSKRRSPRRAPPLAPFSPSPPPPVRYPKKEKDEYFEHHSRYDDRDRHSRYSSSKHHSSSKDYENKYEDDFKYPQDRYENPAGMRNESHHGGSGGRYDYKPSSRTYHTSSHSHRSSAGSAPVSSSPSVHNRGGDSRDRDRGDRDREREKPFDNIPSRRIYEYEPSLVPPGTEQPNAVVPSLFELNIPPPISEGYNSNNSQTVVPLDKSIAVKAPEAEIKKEEVKSGTEVPTEKKDTKEHKRRKSSEEKKLKKEKKKHKKEKKEEKKKEKKRKKSKDGEGGLENIPLELPIIAGSAEKSEILTIEKTLETKLTAPCDSTVKSPDRPPKECLDPLVTLNDSKVDISLGISPDEKADPFVSDRGVVMADLTKQSNLIADTLDTEKVPVHKTNIVEEDEKRFVPIPSSKWDEFDEGDTSFSNDAVTGRSPVFTEDKVVSKESKVPPDVLRRAENVIFDKPTPITVQTISVSVTEVESGKSSKSPTQVKKITMTDIGTLPEEPRESGKSYHRDRDRENDEAGKHSSSKSTSVASTVFRKPVRDRLGSKVSEDEALHSRSKEDDSRHYSRQRRSPVRDLKLDQDRDRGENKVYSRNRRSRSRSRSPLKLLRPRERSRSPQRRERERVIEVRPPPPPDRSDRHTRRSNSRGRDDQRGYRRQARSPLPPLRSVRGKSPEPVYPPRRNYDRHHDLQPRNDSSDGRRRRPSGREEREPSPPGTEKQRLASIHSKVEKSESKSRSSDKSHDGASGVAAAFTNEYAELSARKAKQRINIKLSSTAKLEKDSSSSSEDHEGEDGSSSKVAQGTEQTTGPDAASLKKRKKAKRHKSASSTTSSSSSSDEKQKKKSKKSKKKKKKSSKKMKKSK